jgi:hypothetical protein
MRLAEAADASSALRSMVFIWTFILTAPRPGKRFDGAPAGADACADKRKLLRAPT